MSSLIFCAADRRVLMPHSVFMFHDGSMGYDGTAKQFLTEAEQLKQTSTQMLDIYTDCMMKHSDLWKDKTRAQCRKWLRERMDKKEEVCLRPAEAIENGFADFVFDGDWDLLGDKPV
jgi:ATP-dependent protease ClpP protease subunit